MSDLKFECPSCNQRMECDRALGGDVIHCPKCCAELRIPFPTPHSLPGSVQRAELLHPATGPANTPAPASSQTAQLAANPTSASASLDSAEAICPVCHSQLRFKGAKATGSAGAPLGTAELVRRPEDHALDHCKEKAEPKSAVDNTSHLSFEEREKQIAAAREARPVQLYPAQKPRLEYILSGGATAPKPGSTDEPRQTGPWQPDFFSE